MRQAYRLLGLAKRYGSEPVDTACGRALELDVVSVAKIAAMLEKSHREHPDPGAPRRSGRRPGKVRPRRRRIPDEQNHTGLAEGDRRRSRDGDPAVTKTVDTTSISAAHGTFSASALPVP